MIYIIYKSIITGNDDHVITSFHMLHPYRTIEYKSHYYHLGIQTGTLQQGVGLDHVMKVQDHVIEIQDHVIGLEHYPTLLYQVDQKTWLMTVIT